MRLIKENFENMRDDYVLDNAIHDNSHGRYFRALGVDAPAKRKRIILFILRGMAFSRDILSKTIEPARPDSL